MNIAGGNKEIGAFLFFNYQPCSSSGVFQSFGIAEKTNQE